MNYKEFCEHEISAHLNYLARNFCPSKYDKCEDLPIGFPRTCELCWIEHIFSIEVKKDAMEKDRL